MISESGKIDRQSFEPAYLQLANILQGQIASGKYLPGSRLPSESELCRQYKVSPMTVRRSVKALLDGGVVSTIQGSGTFVRNPVLWEVSFGLDDFQQLLMDKERTRVKLVEANIIKADELLADRLSVNCGDNCIRIRRILTNSGDPVIYHREYLVYDPARPIVEGELEVTSLYGLFVGSGQTHFKRGDLSIESVNLSPEEAKMLNTLEGLSAFRLTHLFYDFADSPMSWGQFICRGDRMSFRTTVGLPKPK